MKFSKSDLARFSERILRVIDKEKIRSVPDLDARVGRTFQVEDFPEDSISIEKRQSVEGTTALIVSYNAPNYGVPIEVRVNAGLRYSKIHLKVEETLPRYAPFSEDKFGNIIQDRRFQTIKFQAVREELERLRNL